MVNGLPPRSFNQVTPFVFLFALTFVATNTGVAGNAPDRSAASSPRRLAMSDAGVVKDKSENAAASKRVAAVTPEVEAEVLQMVETHLPSVTVLLDRLREKQPRQYENAIRDLARSFRRLQLAKRRDPALFDIEVDLMKARTSVNLYVAKLKIRDSDSDRKRLREAVEQLHRSELARAKFDLAAAEQRLEKSRRQLDAAVERLDQKQSLSTDHFDSQYTGLLKKAGRQPKDSTP